jgi:hypothetical protein
MEDIDLKKLIFRRLSYLDFLEFKKGSNRKCPNK